MCLGGVAAASETQAACPDRNGDDVRRNCGGSNDNSGVGPSTPLDHVADRYGGGGIRYLEVSCVEARHFSQLLDDLSRVLLAPTLKIRIDEIVHGMQLFSAVALLVRRVSCCNVGGDGVVP